MNITTLDQLLNQNLRTLYSIEGQLVEHLPSITSKVTNKVIKETLDKHFEETRMQVTRLENIGINKGLNLMGVTDLGIKGILDQSTASLADISDSVVRDAAIVGDAIKVEHYEMAIYEATLTLAKKLSEADILETLRKTYDEEKNAANKLADIADEGFFEKVADALGV